MKKIPLTQGQFAIVDDADYERLSKFKWYYHVGYARRMDYSNGKKIIHIHRVIMDAPEDMTVDHASGDKLDNRRSNLRVCTDSQNVQNSAMRSDNSSGYKGVSWHTNNKWRVQIMVRGKVLHIGMFTDVVEAAKAYNKEAVRHFGEFAKLNPV